MTIQDWFPLGLIGWISLQSKEFSRVFSNTTVQKYQLLHALLSFFVLLQYKSVQIEVMYKLFSASEETDPE